MVLQQLRSQKTHAQPPVNERGNAQKERLRQDISRRKRGMFDGFVARDLDQDGDLDLISTRGNSVPYDGVFWLEQIRSNKAKPTFQQARKEDSEEVSL